MKNNLHATIALAAALLAAAPGHSAFNPAIVPADSQWIVFFDLGTLRDTPLGQQLVTLIPGADLVPADSPVRPDVQKILGAVGSLTAFGTNLTQDPATIDGALVLQGSGELRKIADGLLAAASIDSPDYVTDVTDLPFTAYTIGGQVTIALPPEPIILAGKSREALLKALEVYRGKGRSMANTKHVLNPMLPRGGTFYVLAASAVPSTEGMFKVDEPMSRVLKMARAASIGIGEEGPLAVGHLQLDATSDDLAVKLERIVVGLVAMASLAESSDSDLTAFINSVAVTRDRSMVKLRLAYPTDRIVQMISGLIEEEKPQADRAEYRRRGNRKPPPPVEGVIVAEWIADQDLPNAGVGTDNLVTKTFDPIALKQGSTIILTGRRHEGENARWDYIELIPTTGSPLRFEAEDMRLDRYRIERVAGASNDEVIIINGDTGTARLRFHAADGSYAIKAAYADESDGQSTFIISVVEPTAPTPVEKN